MLGVIYTEAGNIQSVENALLRIGASPEIVADAEGVMRADALVLPGVGAYAPAIASLSERGITAQDMMNYRYPSDESLFELGLRGVYLANFIHWDANHHIKLVREKYGFEISDEPFERTYRRMSNLDDMHENGVHDYLKFIKFGYGRCTDHASKDVGAGEMSRDKAVELVRHHNPIKPKDLKRWLDYVGMEEDELDRIADTFRDPRVWAFQDGEWIKANLWD